MSIFTAVLLALVMGITEIIPVSGTGHLYIFAKLLGMQTGGADFASFRGMLYLGVAFALLMFYHRRIWELMTDLLVLLGVRRPTALSRADEPGKRNALLLLIATAPMAPALLLGGLRTRIETGNHTLALVSLFLCLSGVVLFFATRSARGRKGSEELTLSDALWTGFFQIPTLFPGLSRAGITTSVLLNLGFEKYTALEFSGIMGIPVLLGAGLVQLVPALTSEAGPAQMPYLILGFALSALSAYFTLRILTLRLAHRRANIYAYWCWGAGILSLILFLVSA